jgi:signal transduction histidine kinase
MRRRRHSLNLFSFKARLISPLILILKLGSEFRRQVYMVFKEAVNNSAKHANCTEARIVLIISGGLLTLRQTRNIAAAPTFIAPCEFRSGS